MLRQSYLALRCTRTRTFSTSTRSSKDFVQEMYLKELKAYKPPPQAKDAHEGVVKTFSAPAAPKPPQLPSDLASELSAWDAEQPVLAESKLAPSSSPDELGGAGAKEFLAFLEEDVPKPVHHH